MLATVVARTRRQLGASCGPSTAIPSLTPLTAKTRQPSALDASPRASSSERAARQSTEAMRRRHPPRPGVGVSTPVSASTCNVTSESPREATQTCTARRAGAGREALSSSGQTGQPAVAAEPKHDTRTRAPLAGSRRNDDTGIVVRSRREQRAPVRRHRDRGGARASPPTAVQPPSAPSLRQPTPTASWVSAPVITSRANDVSVPPLEPT